MFYEKDFDYKLGSCAVVTLNRDKAEMVFDDIRPFFHDKIIKEIVCKDTHDIYLNNGMQIKWVRPCSSARAYRFCNLWIDKDIDRKILHEVILPKYFGNYKDIIWI